MEHAEIIRLAVAYTALGVFIFTAAITCLSLIGVVQFAKKSQQSKLFYVLVVEIAVVGAGYFGNVLSFSPEAAQRGILENAERDKGSVYVQVARRDQIDDANRLRSLLSKEGYVAPEAEVVEVAPSEGQVRYFYPEQEEGARRVASMIEQMGYPSFSVRHLEGYQGKVPRSVIEVWFPG